MHNGFQYIVLSILLLASGTLLAQNYQVNILEPSLPEGLSIRQVLNDAQEGVWLLTDQGIYRFDGYRYHQVASGWFEQLLSEQDSIVVIGEDARYRTAINPATRQWELEAWSRDQEAFAARRSKVAVGLKSQHWFTDEAFLYASGEALAQYRLPADLAQVPLFLRWHQQRLFLVSPEGIGYYFDTPSRKFHKMRLLPYGMTVRKVLRHRNYLLIDSDQGIFAVDLTRPSAEPRQLDKATEITAWVSLNDKLLLVGFAEGHALAEVTLAQDGWRVREAFQANDPHRIEPLPFDQVTQLSYDSVTHTLWAVTSSGLVRARKPDFQYAPGILKNFVASLVARQGKVYTVAGGSLFSITTEDQLTARRVDIPANPFALAATEAGLWFSTADHRVGRYQDQRVATTLDLSKRGGIIYYMFGDQRGDVWVSQAPQQRPLPGILKITATGETIVYDQRHGLGNRMLVTKASPSGNIYCAGIGLDTYLYRYDSVQEQFTNLSAPLPPDADDNFEVHDLTMASDSVWWLATTAGLLKQQGQTVTKVRLDGLPNDYEAIAVGLTPDGAVWFSTKGQGLVRYTPDGHVVYHEASGLPTLKLRYRSLQVDPQGRVWLGTDEGLCVSSQTTPRPLTTHAPAVQRVSVAGKPWDNHPSDEVTLPYHPDLLIHYGSLTHPVAQVRYQYRLIGSDSSWTALVPYAPFQRSDLEEGNYRLEVRALQRGGYAKSPVMTYAFRVQTPWYRSWWAWLLYGLSGSGLVTVIVRTNSAHLRREKAAIEQEKDQLAQQLRVGLDEVAQKKAALAQLEKDNFVQQWTTQGAAAFGNLFSLHNQDLPTLCQTVLSQLLEYINAQVGAVYVAAGDGDQVCLRALVDHALADDTRVKERFAVGQGMIGACYETRTRRVITQFPDSFMLITSGLGQAPPACVLYVPMIFQNNCVGVIELASLSKLEAYQLDFIDKVAEMTASRVWVWRTQQDNRQQLPQKKV